MGEWNSKSLIVRYVAKIESHIKIDIEIHVII
jgi:hypothetical protein